MRNEDFTPNIMVTGAQLAEYLGVTDRRIRQLTEQGVLEKETQTKYALKQSVRSYIQYVKAPEPKGNDLKDIEKATAVEKLLHERVKKRKTELSVGLLENQLHRAKDVSDIWGSIVVAVKSRLLAIPMKTAPIIVGIEDVTEVQKIIKHEVYDALREICEYDPAKLQTIEYYEDELDADDE